MRKKISRQSKIFLLIGLLLCLAFLPFCLEKSTLIYTGTAADLADNLQTEGNKTTYQSPFLSLSLGVYEIRITTSLEDNTSLGVNFLCDEAEADRLCANGVSFYPGQSTFAMEGYVLGAISTAYITCTYTNSTEPNDFTLELYRTPGLYRIAFLCCLLLWGLAFFLALLRKKYLAKEVSGRHLKAGFVLAVAVFILFLPCLKEGLLYDGHDIFFHLMRIAGLKDSLSSGVTFPTKIQSGWLYGHGYAVSAFYPDILLLLPAWLYFLGLPLVLSYKVYILVILLLGAGLSYFSFYQCCKKSHAALLGSCIYILAPYSIYNYYGRAALGEFSAMIFFPLLAAGMLLLYTKPVTDAGYKTCKWYIVAGLCGTLCAHLFSTEIAGGLILLVCLLFFKKTCRKETFLELAKAALLSLLLTCWFWLPMLWLMHLDTYAVTGATNDLTQLGTSIASALMLFAGAGGSISTTLYGARPYQAGAAIFFALLGFVLLRTRKKAGSEKNICSLFFGACLLMLLLSTKYFPWNQLAALPGLSTLLMTLQFSTRFLAPAILFGALLCVYLCLWANKACGKKTGGFVFAFLLLLAFLSGLYQVSAILNESATVKLYTAGNMGTCHTSRGEYFIGELGEGDFYGHNPVAQEGLVWSAYDRMGLSVTVTVENTTTDTLSLELPLTRYPGYGVKILSAATNSSDAAPFLSDTGGLHGDLVVEIPAGFQGTIEVSYVGLPVFKVAEGISLTSLLCLLLWFGAKKCKILTKRRAKVHET